MRYEKGRKDASRQKIMEVAAERFRADGIAATGLAAIMSDAGMTNGAFYPHFQSKADLVRETVAAATSATRFGNFIAEDGLDVALDAYLSPEHRDDPGQGCPLAALLPELARQPLATRRVYADNFLALSGEKSEASENTASVREGCGLNANTRGSGKAQSDQRGNGVPALPFRGQHQINNQDAQPK